MDLEQDLISRRAKNKYNPDIIALQEIKVSDEDFPISIPRFGLSYFNYGQKGFHGVAIFSKNKVNIQKGLNGGDDEMQKRYIQCDYKTNLGIISVSNSYFPQGENRKHPDKFHTKRDITKELPSIYLH